MGNFVDSLISQTESGQLTWTFYSLITRDAFESEVFDNLFSSNEYRQVDFNGSYITISENLIIALVRETTNKEQLCLYIADDPDGNIYLIESGQEKLEHLASLAIKTIDPSYHSDNYTKTSDRLIAEYLSKISAEDHQ